MTLPTGEGCRALLCARYTGTRMEALFAFYQYEAYAKLVLALFLGMALGVERTISGKRAGMRTFALVSLGSCLFVVVSELIHINAALTDTVDPTRITAAVVTGIGFLGAGVIIFHRELKGLTTAAGLWTAAGIGVAVGHNLYALAIFATFLSLFVFTVLWHVEHFLERQFGFGSPDRASDPTHAHGHDHRAHHPLG